MAKRILVPLDRSPATEAVLALVAPIARANGAEVRVLHVATFPHDVAPGFKRAVTYAVDEMDRVQEEHAGYLRAMADVHLSGVPTECVVRFGDPVKEILDEIAAFRADLVVASTETSSSLVRGVAGSVAEALMRQAPVTVMLVRPAP
jgi:nucleotide-binding universal stress UspA family protein